MSLIKPNKADNLSNLMQIYAEFIKDPKVRNNDEFFKYFTDLHQESLELLLELNSDRQITNPRSN